MKQPILISLLLCLLATSAYGDLDVLFLGDRGHHRPKERFDQLQPVMAKRGINLTYTEDADDLNLPKLRTYDSLVLYANIDRIEPSQATALLTYVQGGGGFVPLHCATYCFRNNDDVVALMGGQFRRHGTGVFRTELANAEHPINKGFGGFESWDETYVHHLHNEENRTVLSYRVDEEGKEPWTWVRTHGEGRVFYTAWGHDQRTWGNPGFQNLVERGIRWASSDDPAKAGSYLGDMPFPIPEMTAPRTDVAKFEYVDVGAKIPNYPPSRRWGVQNEPLNMMQKPLPPTESIKHYVMPKGFHLELFASEPDLGGKPIAMTWDERGRLWVAETYDYPNELQPEGQGRDRIRICEDTDGDWKADKFTVFADKLSIPTTLTFHDGGVIVQDGTKTLYLKDTDGDDVADVRRVMFTGWNQRDTHGGVSNFQYGLDNWIWAMQGYNTSRPVAPDSDGDESESNLRFAQGFWRFRPDGSEVEFIRSTNNNTWGLGISEEGIIFGSTANHNPSVYMPIANRYYERVKGWTPSLTLGTIAENHLFKPVTEKVRQVDQHGGYTAGAGHALYTARNYPQEYWNRVAFVNGPTGHLVGSFVISPDGADFKSKYSFNLLASDDEWSAPIMSEIGPDGNVWVIDWYNYIIQHNPTPRGFENGRGNAYMTDLRDKKHGRIYRLVYDEAPPATGKSLEEAPSSELVETLKSDVMLWRKHAQRLLLERGDTSVVPALLKLASDQSVDAIGLNTPAIHALWALKGLGALDGDNDAATKVARAALKHPSAGVRRNAIQVQPQAAESVAAILENGLLEDSHPQVRLAAMLAMADLPAEDSAGAKLASAADSSEISADKWMSDALVAAAANNSHGFLKSIATSSKSLSDDLASRVAIVAEHYGRTAPTDSVADLIDAFNVGEPEVVQTIVSGMAAGWPADLKPEMTASFEQNLEKLVNRLDTGGRGQLLRLASIWGSTKLAKYSEAIVDDLLAKIDDEDSSSRSRTTAARELVQFQSGSDSAVAAILDRVNAQTAPELADGFVAALGESNAPKFGSMVIEHIASATPRVRSQAIEMLLRRRESIPVLLDAIDSGDVQLAELALNQRQNLTRHPDRSVRRRAERILERGGALPNADRQKVLEEFASITKITGDALKGKVAFTKVCAKCHKHSGEGADIGPDLTGMAVHPKEELLTHILDPNQSVESNFRLYTVVTVDGQVINGMLASESRTALEFFDAEGKKTTVLREDIDEFVGTRNSLMPEGIEKELNRQELTDLLEFLTQRGSFKPLDFADGATVASDQGLFTGGERYIIPGWETQTFKGVPFDVADPQDGKVKNIILLHGPLGAVCSKMPKRASVKVGEPARAIHLLSGVSGWGHPYNRRQTTSMSVEVHYEDGTTEVTEFKNGLHFADYIRRTDVPESEFAFMVGSHQIRYMVIYPTKSVTVTRVDFVKGDDQTAPIVMAATVETAASH